MLKILLLTSFIFVYNFFEVEIPHGANGILKKGNNEYIALYHNFNYFDIYTIKIEYENATILEEKNLPKDNLNDDTIDVLVINSNLIFYGLLFSIWVDNNGSNNIASWRTYLENIFFQAQAFSNDCLVVCTMTYNFETPSMSYDYHLHLLKAPYIEFYKKIDILTLAKESKPELIGLKDYFVFIKIDEEEKANGIITYKIVDLELNLVNSFTVEYKNYEKIYFSKLSNNGTVNEFLFCILKKENIFENLHTFKCQVIKYENNALVPTQTIEIPISGYGYSLINYFFDENKIIFYFYDVKDEPYINALAENDFINIIQYENQVLSFYKNFKNFSLPKLVHYVRQGYYFHFDFAMTEQGPGLIFNQLFSYLSSICVPKTITL